MYKYFTVFIKEIKLLFFSNKPLSVNLRQTTVTIYRSQVRSECQWKARVLILILILMDGYRW